MARAPLTAQDPARIGAYRPSGRLASGDRADVYEGYDESGARVAIKVLRGPSRPQAPFGAPFACVAEVLAGGVHDGRPYVVSEFVDGPSLAAVVAAHGALTGDDPHRLAAGTAAALTALHEAGVVHGALTADKILLGPDGPRVIDLGRPRPPGASPEADVRAWAEIVRFTATGSSTAEPDALPAVLRPLVVAAASERPPAARELLLRLVAPNESARGDLLARAEERARALRAPGHLTGPAALGKAAGADRKSVV